MLRKGGRKIHATRISAFDLLTIETLIRMTALLEWGGSERPVGLATKRLPVS